MTTFYQGTGKKLSAADFSALAKKYGVPESRLRAVAEIEARGSGYNSQKLLIALYEPHIAYRYAKGDALTKLVKNGLAYKKWERNYPKTSYGRIDQCSVIAGEEVAALSTSWGMGQVMGFNHKLLGFSNALDMVKWLAISEANQLEGIIKFSKASNILDDLIAGNWTGFASGYNGKEYEKNNYHTKLRDADRRWQAKLNNSKFVPVAKIETIDIGTKGKEVVEVQKALQASGYDIEVDGDFGGHTQEILTQYQEANGLTADGQAGPLTKQKLAEVLESKGENTDAILGKPAPIEELETKTGKFGQIWYWLSSLPFAGGLTWFSDWRILVFLFVAILIIAGLGIFAQSKIIAAYKNYREALK